MTGPLAMLRQATSPSAPSAPAHPDAIPPDLPESPLAKLRGAVTQTKAAAQTPPESTPEPRGFVVMCPPTYLDNAIPNNTFMGKSEKIDHPRSMQQYQRTKHLLHALGVHVEEIPPVKGNQDQPYTANVGCAIEPYIVLAHYKAPGRAGEVPVAKQFFEQRGYQCVQPPFFFEGEADLKKLNAQTYIGGFGQFSDTRAFQWIAEQTGVDIIPVHETSEKLYHLDCSLMPIDEENIMVVAEGLDHASLARLERVANLIVVPKGLGVAGVTNGVKIPETKTYLSGTLQPEEPVYRKAMEWLNAAMDHLGYVVTFLDTDAYGPSGADLSCTVMHVDFPPTGQ